MNIGVMMKFGELGRVVGVLSEYEKKDLSNVFKTTELDGNDGAKDIIQWLTEKLESHRGKDINIVHEFLTAVFIILKKSQIQKYEESLSLAEEYVEKTKSEGLEFYHGIFTRERGVILRELNTESVDVISALEESVIVLEKAEKQVKKDEIHKIPVIRIEKAVTQVHLIVSYSTAENFEKIFEVGKDCLNTFLQSEMDLSKCIYLNQATVLFSNACLKLGEKLEQRRLLLRSFKALRSVKEYEETFNRQKAELIMRISDTFEEEVYLEVIITLKRHALKNCPPDSLQDRSVLVHSLCNILIGEYRFKEFLEISEKLPVIENDKVLEMYRKDMEKRVKFVRKHVEDGKEAQLKAHMMNMLPKSMEKKKRKKKCGVCGKEGKMRCGRCKLEFYCSKNCQVSNWKNHKIFCVNVLED